MSDLQEIKYRLIDEDRVMDLFENLGCEYIKLEQGQTLITAQLPMKFDSNNRRSVQCRLTESLPCYIRNRGDFEGDIFSLVLYLEFDRRGEALYKDVMLAKNYICNLFGWHDFLDNNIPSKKRPDFLSQLRELAKSDSWQYKPNSVYEECILNNFIDKPIKSWILEGIGIDAQRAYNVGLDLLTNRITFPIRNRYGRIVGVKGRLIDNSDVTDFNPKYMYLYNCNMSQELFNIDRAEKHARERKEIIVVESEKSVMKFYTFGIFNVVALGSSDISETQVEMLYRLGEDIKVVLAYDEDKTVDEIYSQAKKLENENISFIYDRDDLLPEKDAPIDRGIEVWNELYKNNKYKYNKTKETA